ncbi:phosphotransferase [Vibrio breoganii]|uniref:Phosphotransferase n=2 Tax=Vibrio breoganii TaxID=553239 RepID=A0ABX1UBB9_9VIBR|nr:phosphotransferase [Vibrio breoganii]NMO75228.1 phosphotransferase [Vibrio breoganii]NMR71744.1 phosphotransferase [Vibrio breoganii]
MYKLSGETNSYLFKVYPMGSMSCNQLFNIEEVVTSLYEERYIIRTSCGSIYIHLNYPEGRRIAALYPWIADDNSQCINHQYFNSFGKEIANLHLVNCTKLTDNSSIDFKKTEDSIINFSLSNNAKFLLLESLEYLERYPLDNLEALEKGLCHGDCHIDNAIWSGNKIRLIDFDHLKYDYLASDLVSLAWANHYNMGIIDENLYHLYSGYSSLKLLPSINIGQFQYFLTKKEIEYLLSYLERQQLIGTRFVGDALVKNRLERLKKYKAPPYFFKNLTT